MKKIFGGFAVLSFVFMLSAPVFAAIEPAPLPPHDAILQQRLSPAIRTAIQRNAVEKNPHADEANNKSGVLQNVFSEYGVQFLALIVSLFGVILAVSGFSIANSKKKKHMSTFMNEIDDAFHSFKWKSKRCEAELYRLNDLLEEKLKKGKIDESTFGLLTGRIEKYLKEIQELDSLPEHVRKQRSGD